MPAKITATCLCRAVQISCGNPVGPGGYCHCEDCRKSTGSAFGVNIPFEMSEFRVVCGEVGAFTKSTDAGNELTRHFCVNCGSPLYGTSPQYPGRVYVRAGVIDQPTLLEERGVELERVKCSSIDDVLYFLFSDITHDMASSHAATHGKPGTEFRRLMFQEQLRLFGTRVKGMAAKKRIGNRGSLA
ncbi:Imm63 family immunity protein [Rhizobium sp. PRIMUS64]|uniref:Imm63 family immunity protein n=1 Tax=Rhizobium sp. PRIMUS64 TaxID=2908925 RepID=UPI001FF4B1AD|nr:Imm63 family immunity protein [Rhizobium sp. PRIMUS64]MCJ9696945.1 Imm63 family immunity protein [Rhizobium sp. PRIMUS64]